MTQFRTEFKPQPQQKNLIDHQSKILLLGSCFSEKIGEKLNFYKFSTCINPFGTLFSPTAIEQVLSDTISQTEHTQKDLIQHGEFYHSLKHHSTFSALNSKKVIENIHQAQSTCANYLKQATHVIVTLGTSWVYKHITTQKTVANCHKIPATQFEKTLLTTDQIFNSLKSIQQAIHYMNPNCHLIYTLSPVRHTKDGILENSLSKAQLLTAIHQISNNQAPVNSNYFGSYEIMMDDLRDYRFYEADMIHPNSTAIQYIWERFTQTWMNENSTQYFKMIKSIQNSLTHQPNQPASDAHQQFLKKLNLKKNQLENLLGITF